MRYTNKKTIAINGSSKFVLADCYDGKELYPVVMKHVIPEMTELVSGRLTISKMLDHHGIQKIIDFSRNIKLSENSVYYTCRQIYGVTLTQLLNKLSQKKKDLPLFFIHHIISGICSALSYLHNFFGTEKKDFLPHGNICPDNVLISFKGDIFLTDSGIADIVKYRFDGVNLINNDKSIFNHPDLLKSNSRITKHHELYSVGLLLLYMHVGSDYKFNVKMFRDIKLFGKYFPSLSKSVMSIISNLIFSKTAARYESIREVQNDLLSINPSGTQNQKENTGFLVYALFQKEYKISDTIQAFFEQYANYYLNTTEDESVKKFLLEIGQALPFSLTMSPPHVSDSDKRLNSDEKLKEDFMIETKTIVIPESIANSYNSNILSPKTDLSKETALPSLTTCEKQVGNDIQNTDKLEHQTNGHQSAINAFSTIIKDFHSINKPDNSQAIISSCAEVKKLSNDSFSTFSKTLKTTNTHMHSFTKLIKKENTLS